MASRIWTNSQLSINSESNAHIPLEVWLVNWVLYFRKEDGHQGSRLPLFIAIVWAIWCSRNAYVFRQQVRDMASVQALLSTGLQQHEHFAEGLPINHTHTQDPPTPPGFLVANLGQNLQGAPQIHIQTDGSWYRHTGLGSAAWISTATIGHSISTQGHASFHHFGSALQSETVACLKALLWAKTKHNHSLAISSDSANLVHSLNSRHIHDIGTHHTITDIRATAKTFRWCCITKVPR